VRVSRAASKAEAWRLFRHFLARDLRNRFLGSFSGGLWALIQPLVQLAIYAFVFVHIFKARLPGAGSPGYVPFLMVALWPWTAFSEGVLRATTAILDNAGLIGKVAMPRWVPVLATVSASFVLHSAGFVVIVLMMPLFGYGAHLAWLPLALVAMGLLWILAAGLALLFSALQVFVRDLVQVLTQILTLAMFAAPIFYAREMVPQRYQGWLAWHPFTWYADSMRAMLLHGQAPAMQPTLVAIAVAILLFALGAWLFHRLDPHFEDFL
jgi:lipopolysaccharide transport system permease protein